MAMKQKEIDALRDLAKLVTDEDSKVPISKKALAELLDRPTMLESLFVWVLSFAMGAAISFVFGHAPH